jgi:hypothetical protein
MSHATLEERVARLEKRLDELVQEKSAVDQPLQKDWRRTVGMFKGDAIMKEIIDEALRMREEERREAREQERSEQP